jgi:effector-binding domain-containing protein
MQYLIRAERLEAVPLAVVRRRARQNEFSILVPQACGIVWKAIKDVGTQGGRHVAIYRRNSDGTFDLEIGAEVRSAFPGSGDVIASATPAGEAAAATHFGPYSGLGSAYDAIKQWCTAHNRALGGVCWEIYGHWLPEWNKDPSKIRTDVFYSLNN